MYMYIAHVIWKINVIQKYMYMYVYVYIVIVDNDIIVVLVFIEWLWIMIVFFRWWFGDSNCSNGFC